jgi:hypothetical protein
MKKRERCLIFPGLIAECMYRRQCGIPLSPQVPGHLFHRCRYPAPELPAVDREGLMPVEHQDPVGLRNQGVHRTRGNNERRVPGNDAMDHREGGRHAAATTPAVRPPPERINITPSPIIP